MAALRVLNMTFQKTYSWMGIGIDGFNDSYELHGVFHNVIPITLAGHSSLRVHYDPSSF